MTDQEKLRLALENFDEQVELNVYGFKPDMLHRAIRENPKLAYYIRSVESEARYGLVPKILLKIKYDNLDVPSRDIHIVEDQAEFISLMCQYAGNYKKRLVMMIDGAWNIQVAFNKFTEMYSVFYPNLVESRADGSSSSLIDMPIYDFSFIYRIGKVKLEMMENEIDEEVERVAKMLFIPGMTDATKAFLAHNYLAYTITYTLNERASKLEQSYLQSAYGALIKKKCVCQGYAEAFKRLMDYACVPCDIVCGQVVGSVRDEYHAWNILRLGDGADNYHIDVTWDSAVGGVSYDYFGLSDSAFEGKRIWNHKFNAKCNSTKSLLREGRQGIMKFKPKLLANRVNVKILGY